MRSRLSVTLCSRLSRNWATLLSRPAVGLLFFGPVFFAEDLPEDFAAGFELFLAVGQAWCTNMREQESRMRVQVDPHSPPYWRVNGPVVNLPLP